MQQQQQQQQQHPSQLARLPVLPLGSTTASTTTTTTASISMACASSSTRPEPCVYVKESVLSQLEQEKRALQWQLAQTGKLCDSHKAEVATAQSKLDDLMTIVTINKQVASKHKHKAYQQQISLQQMAQKHQQMQQQVHQQKRQLQQKFMHHFHRRRQLHTAKCVFDAWHQCWFWRQQQMQRAQSQFRHRLRAKVFRKWRQTSRQLSTKHKVANPQRQQVHQALHEFLHLRARMRRQLLSTVFAAWRQNSFCGPKQLAKATKWCQRRQQALCFHRWRMVWRRHTRVNRFIAKRHRVCVLGCFGLWKHQVQRLMDRTKCLRKLPNLVRTRLLRSGLHNWRVFTIQSRTDEWVQVLQCARQALEEEQRTNQQLSQAHLRELQDSHHRFHQKQLTLRQNRLDQMRLARQTQCQRLCFVKWRRLAMHRQLQGQLATQVNQFYRHQYRQRLCAKCFGNWRQTTHRRQGNTLRIQQLRLHRRETLMAHAFAHWHHHSSRIRRFHACCQDLQHRWTRKWLWKRWFQWRFCVAAWRFHLSAVVHGKMDAHAQKQQQLKCHRQLEVLHKQLAVSQMQSSFLMADLRTNKWLQRLFTAWKARAKRQRFQRKMLCRLMQRTQRHWTRRAFGKWHLQQLHARQYARVCRMVRTTQQKRHLLAVWQAWRGQIHAHKTQTRARIHQHAIVRVWKLQIANVTLRRRVLRRLVLGQMRCLLQNALANWHQVAQHWRQQQECRQRMRLNRMRRHWLRWQLFVKNEMRRRAVCHRRMALEIQQSSLLRDCWRTWKQWHRHWQQMHKLRIEWFRQQRARRFAMRMVKAWQQQTMRCRLLVQTLLRVWTRQLEHKLVQAWTQWKHQDHAHQLKTLRIQLTAATNRAQWYEKVGATRQKRFLLAQIWMSWQTQLQMRRQNHKWIQFTQHQDHKHLVSSVFSTWRQECQVYRQLVVQRRQSLLRVLLLLRLRLMESRGFGRWKQFVGTANRTSGWKHKTHLCQLTNVVANQLTARRMRKSVCRWRQFAFQRSKMARRIWCLWQIAHNRILLFALTKWKMQAIQLTKLHRLVVIWQHNRMRNDFTRWRVDMLHQKARSLVCQRLLQLHARCILRNAVRRWHMQQVHQMRQFIDHQLTRQELKAQFLMENLLCKRHAKTFQARCFQKWREFVLTRRLKCQQKLDQQRKFTRRFFVDWTSFVFRRQRLRAIFTRFGSQFRISCVRDAFVQWRIVFCQFDKLHGHYNRQLNTLRRSQVIQQTQLSQKYAQLRYRSWQKPCLIECFTRWKVFVKVICVHLRAQATTFSQHKQRSRLVKLIREWQRFTKTERVVKSFVARHKTRWMAQVWQAWRSFCAITQQERIQLTKLLVVLRNLCQRHHFGKWKEYQQAHFKRQSMMLIVSAQQALKKQQQDHLLQKVAFFFQSKQKTDLRRHFFEWHALCQFAKQRQQLAQAMGNRKTRRWLRGLLRQWLLTSVKARKDKLIWSKLKALWQQRTASFWFRVWRKYGVVCQQRRQMVRRIWVRTILSLQQFGFDTWQRFLMACKLEQLEENYKRMHFAQQQQEQQVNELTKHNGQLMDQSEATRQSLQTLRFQMICGLACKLNHFVNRHIVAKAFVKWNAQVREYAQIANWIQLTERFRLLNGFDHWRKQVILIRNCQLKRQQVAKQHEQMHKVILLMNTSNESIRLQKFWWGWKQFVKRQRVKQQQAMVRIKLIHQLNRFWFRIGFKAWKLLWINTKTKKSKRQLIFKTVNSKRLVKCFRFWAQQISQLKRQRRLFTDCVQMLCKWIQSHHHEWLVKRFWHWKQHMVVDRIQRQFRFKQLVLRLCTRIDTTSLQTLYRWQLTTRLIAQQQQMRLELFGALRSRRLLTQCFGSWHRLISDYKRAQQLLELEEKAKALGDAQPTMAARAPLRRRCGLRISRPSSMTIAKVKLVGPNWMLKRRHEAILQGHRLVAIKLLHRVLSKHLEKLLSRFFWRWFCHVQTFSNALIPFEPLLFGPQPISVDNKKPRHKVHAFGALVVILRNEMQILQHLLMVEKKQLVLIRLVLLLNLSRRVTLQRAFCKWKWRKPRPVSINSTMPSVAKSPIHSRKCLQLPSQFLQNQQQQIRPLRGFQLRQVQHQCKSPSLKTLLSPSGKRVRARALLQKLALVMKRHFFGVWKQVYIQLALRQAQLTETRLLLALEYRQQQHKHHDMRPPQSRIMTHPMPTFRSMTPTNLRSVCASTPRRLRSETNTAGLRRPQTAPLPRDTKRPNPKAPLR